MKNKFLLTTIFVLLGILSFGVICTSAETYQEPSYNNGYYEIENADQLYWFAREVNSGKTSINGRLVSDIIINTGDVFGSSSDYENTNYRKWTAIGSFNNPYSGIFDGNGHTISGLYFFCSNSTQANEYGLYGSLFYKVSGKVHDLNIENSYFYHYNYAAAICGFNSGTIENCYVKAKVQGNYRSGIAYQNTGKIINCDYVGLLFGIGKSASYTGGICYDNGGEIENCSNTSDILDGGGIASNNASYGIIKNCRNSGEIINGYGSYLGGICAYNNGTVSGCVNEGRISSSQLTTTARAGGICGTNIGIVEQCENLANISFYQGFTGGICGENAENAQGSALIKDCLNTGRVEVTSPKACGGICGINYANIKGCYHTAGNIYISDDNTGTICGINGDSGVILNCIDFWYYSGYQIGVSESGSDSRYVIPSRELYSTNAAYFLNCYSTADDVSWYQNIDNGQPEDTYPVLDSTHGKVYSNNSNIPPSGNLPDDVTAKGSYWTLYKNGLLIINSSSLPDYTAYSTPWYSCREEILSVQFEGSLTKVPDYAFFNCTNLKSVQLSDYIYTIGAKAFSNCSSLKSIYISNGRAQCSVQDSAFFECTALEEVSFASNTTVGDNAFNGCTALKSIYINNAGSYGEIKEGANSFYRVTATVYCPRSSHMYDLPNNFSGNLTMQSADFGTCGSNIRWMYNEENKILTLSGSGSTTAYPSGTYAPWGNFADDISKIVVEDKITTLSQYIFEYCCSAEEIILPKSLKHLAYSAFNDCEALKNLILPASLESFLDSWYGFNRCTSLTDVYYVGTEEDFTRIPGYTYATENDVTIHYLVWNPSTATCTQAGYEGYYIFDDTTVYSTIYDINKNEKAAVNYIPATGHNLIYAEGIPSNCHETGIKEHWKCSKCETSYEDPEATTVIADITSQINPDNHEGGTEIRDATEEFSGNTYCLGCGQMILSGSSLKRIEIIGDDIVEGGARYSVVIYPETSSNGTIYWSTDNSYIATVNSNGYLTFHTSGTVKLIAFATDGNGSGIYAEKTVEGTVIATSISISGKLRVISSPTQFTARIYPDNAANQPIKWSISDETIATVDESGLVTPIGIGTVILRAETTDGSGLYDEKELNVGSLVTRISISGDSAICKPTQYFVSLTPSNATNPSILWSISDETIATVDESGLVTPLKNGTVELKAEATDGSGVYDTLTVTVAVSAHLSILNTAIGQWNKEFSPYEFEYILYVPKETEAVILNTTATGGTAYIGDKALTSLLSKRVTLKEDVTEIEITVKPTTSGITTGNSYKITIVKGPLIRVEVSEDKNEILVNPVYVKEGSLVIISYYDGKKFAGMEKAVYEGEEITFIHPIEYTRAKVMVWENSLNIIPVCSPKIIK